MVQGTPRRMRERARRVEPVTAPVFAGLAFLAFATACLLAAAGAAFALGLPYYLTPAELRLDHPLHDRFAPGAPVGLLLGAVGAALMGILLLYSVRKWLPFLPMGSPRFWMRFHLTAGLLGPLFIVLHGGFVAPTGFIAVGFWCMALVAASGFFGRYLFGYLPASAQGRRLDLDALNESLAELRARLVDETSEVGTAGDARPRDLVAEAVSLARDFDGEAETLLELVMLDHEVRRRADLIRIHLRRARLEPGVQREAEATLVAQLAIRRSIGGFEVARRLLRFWNLLHQPLAAGMYCIAALHVLNAILFGGAVPTLLGMFR
jgi:hypothetical protein